MWLILEFFLAHYTKWSREKLQYVFEIEENGNGVMMECFTAVLCYNLGKI